MQRFSWILFAWVVYTFNIVGESNSVDMIQHGKIISSWVDFISALRKQLYPLEYTQTSMIEWLHLTQLKGKNVQAYTQEFKNKYLAWEIPLHMCQSLLKWIGGLHFYLLHTILMFNPTNINEVTI